MVWRALCSSLISPSIVFFQLLHIGNIYVNIYGVYACHLIYVGQLLRGWSYHGPHKNGENGQRISDLPKVMVLVGSNIQIQDFCS